MFVISEKIAQQTVNILDAIGVVERVFSAMEKQEAVNYPVVRESLDSLNAVFGVKSGFDGAGMALGLKAGGYWKDNLSRGVENHQSGILLFDHETGRAKAVVSATYLTGLRTAASSALAAKYIARKDSKTLGIFGAGGQAEFQILAMAKLLGIEKVIAFDISTKNLELLAEKMAESSLDFQVGDAESTASQADILVTVTPSQSPILEKNWIQKGTHICAMGADTKGKQELPVDLVSESHVFVDSIDQAISIGECQNAYNQGMLSESSIKGTIGGLINGNAPGRVNPDEITIYDGTGVALQDLAVGQLALDLAVERNLVVDYEY
jgi:ornithine cyclodeaminase